MARLEAQYISGKPNFFSRHLKIPIASKHHFKMSNDLLSLPNIWKWPGFSSKESFLYGQVLIILWTSENGQILTSEHHFEISEDPLFCPNVWKWLVFSLRIIILRCPGTYFFIWTFENSQTLVLEHQFEVSKKLIFPLDVSK